MTEDKWMATTNGFVGLRQLHARYGLGRSYTAFAQWLKRQERRGRFPARIRLSERILVWDAAAVLAWERARRERGVA